MTPEQLASVQKLLARFGEPDGKPAPCISRWYVRDYNADPRVMAMWWPAKGLNMFLVGIAWESSPPCSLPDDEEFIRGLCSRPPAELWSECWPEVRRYWDEFEGRLWSFPLVDMYLEQMRVRAAKKKGPAAQKRAREAFEEHGEYTVDANAVHMHSGSGANGVYDSRRFSPVAGKRVTLSSSSSVVGPTEENAAAADGLEQQDFERLLECLDAPELRAEPRDRAAVLPLLRAAPLAALVQAGRQVVARQFVRGESVRSLRYLLPALREIADGEERRPWRPDPADEVEPFRAAALGRLDETPNLPPELRRRAEERLRVAQSLAEIDAVAQAVAREMQP
jgi:hypothetical protein